MNHDQKETVKHLALLEELETSNKLIMLGFGEIQNISLNNNFRFLPFQLLSQGFERFMKSYICLGFNNQNGKYPTFKYLKNLGHDLEHLLSEILDNYYFEFDRPQYIEDSIFLKNSQDLKELLFILSEFGKKSRYYNFDLITEGEKIPLNTDDLWRKFEIRHLNNDKSLLQKLFSFETDHEVFYKINSIIIVTFERFVSALSRQFLFGCLGEKAKQISASSYFDFSLIYEKNFGVKDYRKNTTRFKEAPKKEYKRTAKDDLERKNNPNFKSLKIQRVDYTGEWPFYADEVIIECRYKNWCVITIEGCDYALHGSAKNKYQLEFPHDAGMTHMDKPFYEFTKLAQQLNDTTIS